MHVRTTLVKFLPDYIEQAKKIYNEEIAPVVRQQRGNIGIWLLEPTDKAEDFISLTQWKAKSDADAYDNSGLYRNLVKKLDDFISSTPVLKTYNSEEVAVTTGAA
jgi:quinol monooxygenase YgiN